MSIPAPPIGTDLRDKIMTQPELILDDQELMHA